MVLLGLRVGYEPAGAVLLGFGVYTPLERRWRRHDQPVRRPGLRTDVVHLLVTGVLTTAATLVPVVVAIVALRGVPTLEATLRSSSAPVQAVVAFVLLDLLGYWIHRCQHRSAFLWRFHRVHHSSTHLDWIAGARNHPLDGAFGVAVAIVPALLLGVRPDMLGALAAVRGLWAVLLHANVRWRLAWLDGRLATPEFHHWHHSAHPEAYDTNFAAFLPLWDRLFGTYRMPVGVRPTRYGVDDPPPVGWWSHLRAPFHRRLTWF